MAKRLWRPQWWQRPLIKLAASRAGTWFALHIGWYLDRLLIPLSKGRLNTAFGMPVLVLTTTGAKSHQRRTIPLLYLAHGDTIVLVASNGGSRRHSAWYHNLRAHPEATLLSYGRAARYIAREATDTEQATLWREAVEFYPGYASYQQRATGRKIPVMVLTPVGSTERSSSSSDCTG